MLYDFDDLTFEILAVERLHHADGTHRIQGRPFAALAFRLSGEVEFEIGEKRFSSRAGDVCFIPKNVSYTAVYSGCEYVVVHFKKCNYKAHENFSVDNPSYAAAEFSKLHSEWKEKHSIMRAKATLYKLLARIAEDKALTINDQAFLKSVEYMDENLSDPTLSLARVCAAAGISEAGLRRKFHAYYNLSPKKYLIKLRLDRAVELLVSSDKSVKEIALECGFEDEKYFSRIVRSTYRQPPSAFKGKSTV